MRILVLVFRSLSTRCDLHLALIGAVVLAVWASTSAAADGPEEAWAALEKGGVIAVMRHGIAPGTGDPAGFRIDDCATQRNLSEEGRDQARAIGRAFRDRGVAVDGVYSSQWCRALDTARLLDLGPVQPLPALNSFFQRPEEGADIMARLRRWLAERNPEGVLVLVTHQVNISALTGVFPRSGETVVARLNGGGEVEVVGRIPPP